MSANITKRSRRWIIIVLILAVPAGVLMCFYRMYHDDITALKRFMAAYDRFDRAVSLNGDSGRSEVSDKAGEAVIELQARASLRLSSLIKNDGELMKQAREAADLARRELESLGMEGRSLIHEKRIAAYDRFQELSGRRR